MLGWQILRLFVALIFIMAHIICGRQNADRITKTSFSRVYLVYILEVKWIRQTETASFFYNIELNQYKWYQIFQAWQSISHTFGTKRHLNAPVVWRTRKENVVLHCINSFIRRGSSAATSSPMRRRPPRTRPQSEAAPPSASSFRPWATSSPCCSRTSRCGAPARSSPPRQTWPRSSSAAAQEPGSRWT